ncbi:MAG: hypothetical protein ACI4BD_03580 [Paludibacteraceae bacterium]
MKFSKYLFGAMLAVALVSCSGKESLLKDYEKACSNGDAIKAAQIIEKMGEKYPDDADWTEAQMNRIEVATEVLAAKQLESLGNMLGD